MCKIIAIHAGMSRCGPGSVAAMKKGDVTLPYDLKFIFAEVNADYLVWTVDSSTREMKVTSHDYHRIGKNVSTKAVGSNQRHDVTHEYKHPEGKHQHFLPL